METKSYQNVNNEVTASNFLGDDLTLSSKDVSILKNFITNGTVCAGLDDSIFKLLLNRDESGLENSET